jgi:hypothetical protein
VGAERAPGVGASWGRAHGSGFELWKLLELLALYAGVRDEDSPHTGVLPPPNESEPEAP